MATTLKRTVSNNGVQPLVISYLRFSSPEQSKGDSVRRQIEASEQWAQARGWKIDDRLRDEGVSAFRSKNRSVGALGKIIDQIDNGIIPSGSYLIIENFDRLSRNELTEAVGLMFSIINKGITIVTLDDGREYAKENFDFTQLIISASSMMRANDESKKKSERVGAAWRQKKHVDAAEGKMITKMLPPWLTVKGDKIEPLPAKAKILKEIFDLALKGRGALWISKHLNSRDGVGFGESPWNDTYIKRTLRNVAVIGHYQPHKRIHGEDGKVTRVPDGELVKGYFPQVIDDNTFYAVQHSMTGRVGTGGPSTKAEINIFNGIMFDQEGHTIVRKVHNTWRPYYFSSGATNGISDNASHLCFPANQFDHAVLIRLCNYVPQSAMPKRDNELKAIDGRISEINAKLVELQAEVMQKPLRTLVTLVEKVETELTVLEQQRQAVLGEMAISRTGAKGFAEVYGKLDRVLTGMLTEAERLEIREVLRVHVSKINVAWFKGNEVSSEIFNGRDYVCGADIQMADGQEIEIDFALQAINYRKKGYNKANPYVLGFLIRPPK